MLNLMGSSRRLSVIASRLVICSSLAFACDFALASNSAPASISSSTSAPALDPDVPCLLALTPVTVFDYQFYDQTCYKSGRCQGNALRFLATLKGLGLGIESQDAQVVILPRFKMSHIRTDRLSGCRGTEFQDQENISCRWNYHVVVMLRGHIYDFDYRNRPTPTPVGVFAYLAWNSFDASDPDRHARLTPESEIFVVDAEEYIRNFKEIDLWLEGLAQALSQNVLPPAVRSQPLQASAQTALNRSARLHQI